MAKIQEGLMARKYLQLNQISAYTRSFALSNLVWELVIKWDYFERKSVGIQFTRSIDSISANIAEGFGRYSKKDKIKFYRYGMGSCFESLDWNEKAKKRGLVSTTEYENIFGELTELPKEINLTR
jgi:four helix bundle protein